MRLVFFCGGPAGERMLDWLLKNYNKDIIAIVFATETQLFKHTTLTIPHIKFLSNNQLYDFMKSLDSFDLGLLGWWPNILPKIILNLSKRGFINMHPSLLPFNKGRNPNFWALTEQTPYGVTLLFADEGIDTGDIIAQN